MRTHNTSSLYTQYTIPLHTIHHTQYTIPVHTIHHAQYTMLTHTKADALWRRQADMQTKLANEEETKKEAFNRRLKLQAKGQRMVEQHHARQAASGSGGGGAEGELGGVGSVDPETAAAHKAREAKKREERELARMALQVWVGCGEQVWRGGVVLGVYCAM